MLKTTSFIPFTSICSAAIVLLTLVPLASAASKQDSKDFIRIKPGDSSIGNYLAGRHAQAQHDLGAAVTFLNAALKAMPDARDLRRHTFFLLVR